VVVHLSLCKINPAIMCAAILCCLFMPFLCCHFVLPSGPTGQLAPAMAQELVVTPRGTPKRQRQHSRCMRVLVYVCLCLCMLYVCVRVFVCVIVRACTCVCVYMCRVGQNCIYTPYMTVYFVISLPEVPYMYPMYMVLANPMYVCLCICML